MSKNYINFSINVNGDVISFCIKLMVTYGLVQIIRVIKENVVVKSK